jgi:uncharacterized protein (TIGR03118 family)
MCRLIATAVGAGLVCLACGLAPVRADYIQTNLVSNIANPPGGPPALIDPQLVNPWGVSFSATSPFWVSNQGSNTSTLYTVNAAGVMKSGTVVTVPVPTGQVQNNTAAPNFQLGNSSASFIFASLNGGIYAWNAGAGTMAVQQAMTPGAGYTGLAISNVSNLLYAASGPLNRIDVFNGQWMPLTLTNAFQNPFNPSQLVPFNVQNIGGNIYVAYAPPGHAAQTMATEGMGGVAVFDTSGNLIKVLINGSKLAAPWGMALAPASFGQFAGDLLVDNFSYVAAEINAFDPNTGAYVGTLTDPSGTPLLHDAQGLWALAFGNGGSGGNPNTLYFATGLNGEMNGLFGAIQPAQAEIPEPGTAVLFVLGGLGLLAVGSWRGRKAGK